MNDCCWNDTDTGKPKYLETQIKPVPMPPSPQHVIAWD